MNTFVMVLALCVAVSVATTITNNNNATPGQSITNNNHVDSDGLFDDLLQSELGASKKSDNAKESKPKSRSSRFSTSSIKVKLMKQKKVKVDSQTECPYGTEINNNQGKKEIYCLREGVPSVINNNN